MAGFEQAWTAAARARDGEPVSPELRPLLQAVYSDILARPIELSRLKHSIEHLLEFLANQGRTNANCWAVNLFFMDCDGWEGDWGDVELPEKVHDVLAGMSEALHDTVRDPHIAANFGCLPEQLLTSLRSLDTGKHDSAQAGENRR